MNNQNLILPAGTAKIGEQEYQIKLNSSPDACWTSLNDLPVQDGEWRNRVYEGRRPGPRRIRRADQHRPHQRPRGALLTVLQERQGLHAGHRQST